MSENKNALKYERMDSKVFSSVYLSLIHQCFYSLIDSAFFSLFPLPYFPLFHFLPPSSFASFAVSLTLKTTSRFLVSLWPAFFSRSIYHCHSPIVTGLGFTNHIQQCLKVSLLLEWFLGWELPKKNIRRWLRQGLN